MALTSREKKFVAAFDGNGTKACKAAGYAGDDPTLATQAWRLRRKPEVLAALKKREEGALERINLTRDERLELLSGLALDDAQKTRDRIRAVELLCKAQGDFTERLEVRGGLTLEALVLGSMKKPEKK